MPAPIALFAFNRPDHLARTLTALAANELASESDLYIFRDGPRNEQESSLCAEVAQVAHGATGFKSVTVHKQEKNRGLASSIIEGVTNMVAAHGHVIVLEDDLVTSPYFLRYMNDGLTVYADNPKVASIHGWCFPHTGALPETFFLRGTDCLGWATWKRAWNFFEAEAGRLRKELNKKGLVDSFNCNNAFDYVEMLQSVEKGKVSSWAVRWRATAYLNDMYTLHPGSSLVQHMGGDGSGSNAGVTDIFDVPLSLNPIEVHPQPVVEDERIRVMDMLFHSRFNCAPCSLSQRIVRKVLSSPLVHKNKEMIIDWLPPALYRFLAKLKEKRSEPPSPWQGDYPDWKSACAACDEGYSSDAIFERVKAAALAVQNGQALWERDSVLFYKEEYSWPLVAGLMAVAAKHKGNLHVLDFGGALGSTFQQNKRILELLPSVSWHIVEQPHVVESGKQQFTTATCIFHENMNDCFANAPINVVLFSGVLQYMPEPYALLQEALDNKPDAILIDRTPFLPDSDKITVQHVPEAIYPAQYPCWWLNRSHIASMLANSYTCLPDYESPVDPNGFYGFLAIKHLS